MSNHVLIRLIRFVSRFTVHLCNAIYFSTTFSTPYKQFKFFCIWRFGSRVSAGRPEDLGRSLLPRFIRLRSCTISGFSLWYIFTDRTAYLWESSRGTGTPSLVLSGTSVIYHKENQRHNIRLKLVLAILLLLIEDSFRAST